MEKWINGKVIGKGSYGVVSLGFRGGETFAVKTAEKRSVEAVNALENEIDILKSISSPYVVEYYGDDETLTTKNLFMEYVPGGDVAAAGKIADVDVVRSYAWCLVAALAAVHGEGIVHCDVKGSNLLVDPTRRLLKLADFGSAKRAGGPKTGPAQGSPLWMAPETVRGESQGYEADVWAVGCTVIEMLTGMPAWRDEGAHTLFKIGYSDELPEYPAQLPELARDFLDKCLARQPEQRWCCSKLLQHPFLIPQSKTTIGYSPKSVFDWDDFHITNDDHDDDRWSSVSDQVDNDISAKGRIGNLATVSRVNWENEDWIDVRKMEDEYNSNDDLCCELTTTQGLILEIHNYFNEYNNNNDNVEEKWISLRDEISEEVVGGGGDGGERWVEGGLVCRQTVRREENKTGVMKEFSVLKLVCLLFTLYCSTSVGLPNVAIFVYKINEIHWFWINFLHFTSLMFQFHLSITSMLKINGNVNEFFEYSNA